MREESRNQQNCTRIDLSIKYFCFLDFVCVFLFIFHMLKICCKQIGMQVGPNLLLISSLLNQI